MPRVHHMRVEQGFRPFTNPRPLAHLHGLGDSLTFSGCVQAYDADSNPVACSDPTAAVWIDGNGNAVPAGTQTGASAGAAATGEAPTGTYLTYNGHWTTTLLQSASKVLRGVLSALQGQGLQVVNSSYDSGIAGSSVPGYFPFAAQLQVRVTGSGFARADDARSIIDHAVYVQTQAMPQGSTIFVSGGTGANPLPSGGSTGSSAQSPISWLEDNAVWIGLGLLAVTLGPALIRKL